MNKDQKNRLQITIFGQQYTIVGNASSSYIRMVAGHVDEKMKQIAELNPRLDTTKIAVLTAVNIADEFFKLKQDYEELLKILDNKKE